MTKRERIKGICADLRSGRFARKQAKPRRWCRHIKWQTNSRYRAWMVRRGQYRVLWMLEIPDTWNCCPICAKPRPR